MKCITFKTSCSFSKWEWQNYGEFERYLDESTNAIKRCWEIFHALCIATPIDIAEKRDNTIEPITYLTSLIDDYMEEFQCYVFKYSEANMVNDYFDESTNKEMFFKKYSIEVRIPDLKITDYNKLVAEIDNVSKKEEKLLSDIYALCYATPKDIVPEKVVPFDWVNEKFDNLFTELLSAYDLHTRLVLMQDECLYSDKDCYKGMNDDERKQFFFKKKVTFS